MTMHPIPSEFPYIWGKFCFLFYQCIALNQGFPVLFSHATVSYNNEPKRLQTGLEAGWSRQMGPAIPPKQRQVGPAIPAQRQMDRAGVSGRRQGLLFPALRVQPRLRILWILWRPSEHAHGDQKARRWNVPRWCRRLRGAVSWGGGRGRTLFLASAKPGQVSVIRRDTCITFKVTI